MSIKNLDAFFNPKRIAVIGAAEDPKTIGASVFGNLIGKAYKGAVYPVNSRLETVRGVEAYRKIADIQREIDLAILADTCENVMLEQLEECGAKRRQGSQHFVSGLSFPRGGPPADGSKNQGYIA